MANVGQQFTANGYTYQVNADGSTTNLSTGHTYGTPTPTNNLATMGAPQTGISDASEASTNGPNGNSTASATARAIAYNAAHPGQMSEWVYGMDPALRNHLNPPAGAAPAAPATTPPAPQPPTPKPPAMQPPTTQPTNSNYPGPFPPNPSLNALSAWRQSHQGQPELQPTGVNTPNPQGPNTKFPLNPAAGGPPQQPWWQQGQGQQPDTTQHQPWHPFGIDPSQVDAWHQFDHGPQGQMGQWWQNHQQQPPVPVPPQPQPVATGTNWPNPGQGQPLNPIGIPNRY